MRRIVTAESESGVVVQARDLLESTSADLTTNIWGFDQLPNLPLAAKQVLGDYQQKGIFGPKRRRPRRRPFIAPESGNHAADLGPLIAKLDLGTGHNITPGKSGGGMHRTTTVAADSACIGDGQSTLTQGIVSAVNETAYRLGARVGETALDVARTVAERA